MAADPRAEAGAVFSDEAPRERQVIRGGDDDNRVARQPRALSLWAESGRRKMGFYGPLTVIPDSDGGVISTVRSIWQSGQNRMSEAETRYCRHAPVRVGKYRAYGLQAGQTEEQKLHPNLE